MRCSRRRPSSWRTCPRRPLSPLRRRDCRPGCRSCPIRRRCRCRSPVLKLHETVDLSTFASASLLSDLARHREGEIGRCRPCRRTLSGSRPGIAVLLDVSLRLLSGSTLPSMRTPFAVAFAVICDECLTMLPLRTRTGRTRRLIQRGLLPSTELICVCISSSDLNVNDASTPWNLSFLYGFDVPPSCFDLLVEVRERVLLRGGRCPRARRARRADAAREPTDKQQRLLVRCRPHLRRAGEVRLDRALLIDLDAGGEQYRDDRRAGRSLYARRHQRRASASDAHTSAPCPVPPHRPPARHDSDAPPPRINTPLRLVAPKCSPFGKVRARS